MSSFEDWRPSTSDTVRMTAMLDELIKIAKTRAAKEWQKAHAVGDQVFADQIAQGYGDLDLSPRHLKDVHEGGAEAGVDLMMGTAGDRKLKGGYVARKMYKPDSRLHRGEHTRRILDMKQRFADDMMGDPKMRPHALDMAGYKEVQPGKFVSYHEYLPGVRNLDLHNPRALDAAFEAEQNVINPMRQKGKVVDDVVMRGPLGRPVIHTGNIAEVSDVRGGRIGKILDFLPYEAKVDPAGRIIGEDNPAYDWVMKNRSEAGIESVYGNSKDIGDLRKAIFEGSKKPEVVPAGSAVSIEDAIGRTVVPRVPPVHIDPRVAPRPVPVAHPQLRTIAREAGDKPWIRRHPLATAALLAGGTIAAGAGLDHYLKAGEKSKRKGKMRQTETVAQPAIGI